MEYLRYPTPAERKSAAFTRSLALALCALHRLPPPAGVDVAWPFAAHDSFESITQDDAFWSGLALGDRAWLELLRARRETYVRLLPALERELKSAPRALTHGDLAGDNLMLKQDGSLALADWGAARVSAGLLDVAHVLVYAEWSQKQAQRFLRAYFGPGETPPILETLQRVCRYQACLRSLQALNELGADGLDAVGRAFFERQLEALK
jgi:aminoglycoside phosphotransferase (APT) family kinase protein